MRYASRCDLPTLSFPHSDLQCTWTSEEDSRRPATKQYVESLKHTNTLLRDRVTALEGLLQQSGIQYEQFSAPVAINAPTSSPYISVPSLGGPYGTNNGGHSPTGSSTDLPGDSSILLAPEDNSDVDSVAESLSNAAARIVVSFSIEKSSFHMLIRCYLARRVWSN